MSDSKKPKTASAGEPKRPKPSLELLVMDPGFTPSVKHVADLVTLAGDEELSEHVERALARLGSDLGPAVAPLYSRATPRARVHVARAMGRTAEAGAQPESIALLLAALPADEDERARRAAATALGKLAQTAEPAARASIEEGLATAFERATTDSERRVLAEALGKSGAERARAVLAAFSTHDESLAKVVSKARLVLDRNQRRHEEGGIRGDASPAAPLPILFTMRKGLESIVIEELGRHFAPSYAGDGRVRGKLRGPLSSAYGARAAERFAIALPDVVVKEGDDLAAAIASALIAAEPIVAPLTDGRIRFRVSWSSGGHRRAVVWSIAEAIAKAEGSALVNDPKESLWELVIGERSRGSDTTYTLSLVPRGLPDPRFTYRSKDVPAASHPTLAAALAHVAGVVESDVVWDPFVGSGLELIERGRLGPFRALHGTDIEASALDAARANLSGAGLQATLHQGDALSHFPEGTTLVITNPPMGRRVHRQGDIGDFLAAFVAHVGAHLSNEARMVWLSPQPRVTAEAAARANLELAVVSAVDMGGFEAELQVLRRRRGRR